MQSLKGVIVSQHCDADIHRKSGKKGAARENAFTSECMSESFSLDDAIECASS